MKMPELSDCPEKRTLIITGSYWFLMFFMIPIVLIYCMDGFYNNQKVMAAVDIVYHFINLVCAFLIFREYLIDSWLTVQIQKKKFIKTVSLGALFCVGFMRIMRPLAMLLYTEGDTAWQSLPIVEMELFVSTEGLILLHPVFGTLSVVGASLTVSCLLYGLGFATPCYRRPWLGYVVMFGVLLLHRSLFYYTVGSVQQAVAMFLTQLPIHIAACIAYHYADTIWAPIFIHAILGLAGSAMALLGI